MAQRYEKLLDYANFMLYFYSIGNKKEHGNLAAPVPESKK